MTPPPDHLTPSLERVAKWWRTDALGDFFPDFVFLSPGQWPNDPHGGHDPPVGNPRRQLLFFSRVNAFIAERTWDCVYRFFYGEDPIAVESVMSIYRVLLVFLGRFCSGPDRVTEAAWLRCGMISCCGRRRSIDSLSIEIQSPAVAAAALDFHASRHAVSPFRPDRSASKSPRNPHWIPVTPTNILRKSRYNPAIPSKSR